MACAPRDILIEQVQVFNNQQLSQPFPEPMLNNYDIRFSQAIKLLFFGVVNATSGNGAENAMCNRSNYTSRQPVLNRCCYPERLLVRIQLLQLLSCMRILYVLLLWVQTISHLSAHGILHHLSQILQVSIFTHTRLISCASTHLDQQTMVNSPISVSVITASADANAVQFSAALGRANGQTVGTPR